MESRHHEAYRDHADVDQFDHVDYSHAGGDHRYAVGDYYNVHDYADGVRADGDYYDGRDYANGVRHTNTDYPSAQGERRYHTNRSPVEYDHATRDHRYDHTNSHSAYGDKHYHGNARDYLFHINNDNECKQHYNMSSGDVGNHNYNINGYTTAYRYYKDASQQGSYQKYNLGRNADSEDSRAHESQYRLNHSASHDKHSGTYEDSLLSKLFYLFEDIRKHT